MSTKKRPSSDVESASGTLDDGSVDDEGKKSAPRITDEDLKAANKVSGGGDGALQDDTPQTTTDKRMTTNQGTSGRAGVQERGENDEEMQVFDAASQAPISCWSSFVDMICALGKSVAKSYPGLIVSAMISLLPIVDVISDVYAMGVWLYMGWYWFFSAGLVVLLLSFRFSMLCAAINPKPTYMTCVRLYVPFFLSATYYHHICRDGMSGATPEPPPEETTKKNEEEKPQPNPTVPPNGQGDLETGEQQQDNDSTFPLSSISFRSSDARHWQGVVRDFLSKRLRATQRRPADQETGHLDPPPTFCRRLGARMSLETKLLLFSVIGGPYFIGQAAFALAKSSFSEETIVEDEEKKKLKRQKLLGNVITFVEAIVESLPQLILQTFGVKYLHDSLPLYYVISMASSVSAICYAIAVFVWYRSDMLQVLGPMRIIDVAGRTGWAVDAVVFHDNAGFKKQYGGQGGAYEKGIRLDDDEVIVRVEGDQSYPGSEKWLGAWIKFTTSKGNSFELRGSHPERLDAVVHYEYTLETGITGLDVEYGSPGNGTIKGVY